MDYPSRIYLTGFMGSGKSTVGPRLAQKLGYTFHDLDALIEQQTGRSIPALFSDGGEEGFRNVEAKALRATEAMEQVVVALGGGTLVREENLAWVLAHGTVVYLHVPPPVLVRRLRRGQAGRPLLCDDRGHPLSPEALRQKVEAMLTAREPYYRRAHLTVEAGAESAVVTTRKVMQALAWHY